MNDSISIDNENIANYVMFKLDKLDNIFSKEELDQITELVIDYNDEEESSFIFLEELLKFSNLKIITLRNGYIYNDNYNIFIKLLNLSEVVFEDCEFENADLIASLKLESLSLINCKLNNYLFISIMKDLRSLSIINGNIEIDKINTLNNLDYLQLSYSKIIDSSELNVNNITELYIDNSNITNLSFVTNLTNLQRLSIDEKQYNANREVIEKLLSKNILILNENMVEFGGDNNEV